MEVLKITTVLPGNKISLPSKFGLKKGEKLIIFQSNDTLVLKKISIPNLNNFEKLAKWGRNFAKRKKIKPKDVIIDD